MPLSSVPSPVRNNYTDGLRLRAIAIGIHYLASITAQDYWQATQITDGIPADAQVIDVVQSWPNLYLICAHESFAEVPEGDNIPGFDIVVRTCEPAADILSKLALVAKRPH